MRSLAVRNNLPAMSLMRPPPVTPRSQNVDERAQVRAWIEAIKARHKIELREIAARAGVAVSTIYRWFDDAFAFQPSRSALRKIAQAFNVEMPGEDASRAPGFAEREMVAIAVEERPDELRAGLNQGVWRVATRALEMIGYLPGDMVLVDMAETPRPGDVVCAQVYDFQHGAAETKLRVYEPPYLVCATMDPAAREAPIYLDHERATIAGVVTRMLRARAR